MELDLFKNILPEYTMNVIVDTGQKLSVFNFKYAWVVSKTDMIMKLAKVVNSKWLDGVKKVLAMSCDTYNGKYSVSDSMPWMGHQQHFKETATNYVIDDNEVALFFWRAPQRKKQFDKGEYILDKRVNVRTLEEVTIFNFDTFNRQN